jgi:hypothetical protein
LSASSTFGGGQGGGVCSSTSTPTNEQAFFPERLRRLLNCIRNVNDLARWKSEATRTASLSVMDLVARARAIESELDDITYGCFESGGESGTNEAGDGTTTTTPHCLFRCGGPPPPAKENPFENNAGQSSRSSSSAGLVQPMCSWHQWLDEVVSEAFSHGARIYLYSVVSGSNPKLREIQRSVERAIELFKVMAGQQDRERRGSTKTNRILDYGSCLSPLLLRCVAWPLCLTGCLLGRSTNKELEDRMWFSATLGGLPQLGDILRVIKCAWKSLDTGQSRDCVWGDAMVELGLPRTLIV